MTLHLLQLNTVELLKKLFLTFHIVLKKSLLHPFSLFAAILSLTCLSFSSAEVWTNLDAGILLRSRLNNVTSIKMSTTIILK